MMPGTTTITTVHVDEANPIQEVAYTADVVVVEFGNRTGQAPDYDSIARWFKAHPELVARTHAAAFAPGSKQKSLRVLSWLPRLQTVEIANDSIEDVSDLARMKNLTKLIVKNGAAARRCAALLDRLSLQFLEIAELGEEELPAIVGLRGLASLSLDSFKGEKICGISGRQTKRLYVKKGKVLLIDGAEGPALESLFCIKCSKLTSIKNTSAVKIDLEGCKAFRNACLQSLVGLRHATFRTHSPVSDWSFLSACQTLEEFYLVNTNASITTLRGDSLGSALRKIAIFRTVPDEQMRRVSLLRQGLLIGNSRVCYVNGRRINDSSWWYQ